MKVFRTGAAPYVPKAARQLARTAPELWAEQERRRAMLEKGEGVTITYRPASTMPPVGELRKIVLRDKTLDSTAPRELRFIGESVIKTFLRPGESFRDAQRQKGDWLVETMQRAPCLVADVGDGLVLGYVLYERDLIHCLYVKSDFRGLGIGLGLLRAAGVTLPLKVERVTRSWKKWTEGQGIPWDIVS